MNHFRNRIPRRSLNSLAAACAAIWLTAFVLAGTSGSALGSPQDRANAAYKEASGQFHALRSTPGARPWAWRSLARRFAAVHGAMPGTRLGADALFSAALSHREAWRLKGDWKDLSNAAAAFREFASRYPDDRLTDDSLMHLATLQAQGYHDSQTAIATYHRIARDFSKSDQAANAQSKADELIAALKIGAPVPGRRMFAPQAEVADTRRSKNGRKNGAPLAGRSGSGPDQGTSRRTQTSRQEIRLEEFDPNKIPNKAIASHDTGRNPGRAASGMIAAGAAFGSNKPRNKAAPNRPVKSSRRNRLSKPGGLAKLKKLEYQSSPAQSSPAWSRVILTTDAGVKFTSNRLNAEGDKPGRLYFDLENTGLAPALPAVTPVGDPLLHRIRISRYDQSTARVVLDLKKIAGYQIREFPLPGELRIIVELRPATVRIARNELSPATRQGPRNLPNSPKSPKKVSIAKPGIPAPGKIKPVPAKTLHPAAMKIATVKISRANSRQSPGIARKQGTGTPSKAVSKTRNIRAPARKSRIDAAVGKASTGKAAIGIAATAKADMGKSAPTVRQKGGKSTGQGKILSLEKLDGVAVSSLPALEIRSIMLDPGHGGHDPGASGFGLKEKHLALNIAKRLREYFKRHHPQLRVGLTREKDTFIKLSDRPQIAKAFGADLFISIHLNANSIERFHGVETYFLNLTQDASALQVAARENNTTTQSVNDLNIILADLLRDTTIVESSELARTLQSTIVGTLRNHTRKVKDLGVKQAPFLVLMGAEMPSVLVEAGFLTNRGENRRLRNDEYIDRIAKGFYEGLRRFIKQQEILASRQPVGPLALNR